MWYAQTVDQRRDQRTHLTTPNQQLTVTIHLARVRSVHVLVRLYHAPHTSTLAMHRPSGIRQLLLANRQQPITQGKASWRRSKISACLWQGLAILHCTGSRGSANRDVPKDHLSTTPRAATTAATCQSQRSRPMQRPHARSSSVGGPITVERIREHITIIQMIYSHPVSQRLNGRSYN
jgi:hypothetical protein